LKYLKKVSHEGKEMPGRKFVGSLSVKFWKLKICEMGGNK